MRRIGVRELYLGMGPAESSAATTMRAFDAFVRDDGERLRRVLAAQHGADLGNDLTADAIAFAWEHWERVGVMTNPIGYLYRVAQTSARRRRRWRRPTPFPAEPALLPTEPDPGLGKALRRLGETQRTCVVLVHVCGWTYDEVAQVLEINHTSVRNHVHRGLKNLRVLLEGQ